MQSIPSPTYRYAAQTSPLVCLICTPQKRLPPHTTAISCQAAVSSPSGPQSGYLCKHEGQHMVACQASTNAQQSSLMPTSGRNDHDQLLQHLSSLSLPEIRQYVQQYPDSVNLAFMEWLASSEDQLEGEPKLKLAVLAGQLMALREGLDPCAFEDVAEGLQQQWQAAEQPAQQSLASDRSSVMSAASTPELFPSSASSLHRSLERNDAGNSSLQAFSPAGILRQYEQVRLLNLDIQEARAKSTVQIIGRKKISNDSQKPSISTAAHRILEYLLEMPTAEMRRDVLPEAFLTPADGRNIDASAEDCESETEELSTTPLQLLQAVDLELTRLQSAIKGPTERKALPEGNLSECQDLHKALHELRNDILNLWDAE